MYVCDKPKKCECKYVCEMCTKNTRQLRVFVMFAFAMCVNDFSFEVESHIKCRNIGNLLKNHKKNNKQNLNT